eukprot:356365-Chlamydomonas_euryale.AAC.6
MLSGARRLVERAMCPKLTHLDSVRKHITNAAGSFILQRHACTDVQEPSTIQQLQHRCLSSNTDRAYSTTAQPSMACRWMPFCAACWTCGFWQQSTGMVKDKELGGIKCDLRMATQK